MSLSYNGTVCQQDNGFPHEDAAMTNDHRNIIRFISESKDDNFQLFIRGHLYLEALLSEILQRSCPHPESLADVSSMFYRKVKIVRALGKISDSVEQLLLSINNVRNKLAHSLDYKLTFDTAFQLVQEAHAAGLDFSDDTIHFDKVASEELYGIYGVINEVICNAYSHLILENEDIFTQEDIGRFLA